jgi:hypothetical protein
VLHRTTVLGQTTSVHRLPVGCMAAVQGHQTGGCNISAAVGRTQLMQCKMGLADGLSNRVEAAEGWQALSAACRHSLSVTMGEAVCGFM